MAKVNKEKYTVKMDSNIGSDKDGKYIKKLTKGKSIFLTDKEALIYKKLNII